MLTYHPFRNTDPPVITGLWRSRAGQPGLLPTVSNDLFEQLVFAKLYFDYDGLIIARDDGRPVGFAHAGFGPNAAMNGILTDAGVICPVLVRPDCAEAEVAAGCSNSASNICVAAGPKSFTAADCGPSTRSTWDSTAAASCREFWRATRSPGRSSRRTATQEAERTLIMHCDLSRFETVFDRRQMEIRRRMIVQVSADPPSRTWWEASTWGEFDMTRFALMPRGVSYARGLRRVPQHGTDRQHRLRAAQGLMELHVDQAFRRRGLAVFLLTEAFRQFLRDGIAVVETQALQSDAAALGLFAKLRLKQVAQGSLWRKAVK